jgi:hypothetical protein
MWSREPFSWPVYVKPKTIATSVEKLKESAIERYLSFFSCNALAQATQYPKVGSMTTRGSIDPIFIDDLLSCSIPVHPINVSSQLYRGREAYAMKEPTIEE